MASALVDTTAAILTSDAVALAAAVVVPVVVHVAVPGSGAGLVGEAVVVFGTVAVIPAGHTPILTGEVTDTIIDSTAFWGTPLI